MALDGKQIKPATVANDRLATASATAAAHSVVVSNADSKIDISYIPVEDLALGATAAFVEDTLTTLETTADGDPISGTGLTQTPSETAVPLIYLNGVLLRGLTYGNKSGSCFFSNTDGATAAVRNALTSGTKLYWNASVAGFQLQAGWRVRVIYTVPSATSEVGVGGTTLLLADGDPSTADFIAQAWRIHRVDITEGDVVVTLPASQSPNTQIVIKLSSTADGNICTIDGGGSTIDNENTLVLATDYEWASLVSDGTNWVQIS